MPNKEEQPLHTLCYFHSCRYGPGCAWHPLLPGLRLSSLAARTQDLTFGAAPQPTSLQGLSQPWEGLCICLLTFIWLPSDLSPSLASPRGSPALECIHWSLQFGANGNSMNVHPITSSMSLIDMEQDRSLERPLQLSTCYQLPGPYDPLTTAL